MNPVSDTAAQAAIGAAARELRLPTVRAQAAGLAEIAARHDGQHVRWRAEILREVDDSGSACSAWTVGRCACAGSGADTAKRGRIKR
jgi:hypothetical protein